MLGTKNIVAFVPTTDFETARSFYEGVLGLRFVHEDGFALVLDANGIMSASRRCPISSRFPYTILGWEVSDIESDVAALGERGVKFEHYGFPGQDALGVWTAPSGDKVAWFKDPDGNAVRVAARLS